MERVTMAIGDKKRPDREAEAREYILTNIVPKLGNETLRRQLRRGDLGMSVDPVNLKRRLEEFLLTLRYLEENKPDSSLLVRLSNCSKRKPCNSVLSPIVKAIEAEKVQLIFRQEFEELPEEQVFWETIILSIHYGHYMDIRASIEHEIGAFREKIRNILKKASFGKCTKKYGYFEVELYRSDDVQEALDQNRQRYPDPKERKRVLQKAELMKALGWSRAVGDYFFVLHYHSMTVTADVAEYRRTLERHFHHPRQIDMGRLYSNKSRSENLDYLAGYLTKVASRVGRLLDHGKQRPLLRGNQLRDFIRIHRRWNFRNLCFRYGV
jgi:hypothetical protein